MDHPPFKTTSALSACPDVRHGFFGRAGGVSTGLYHSLNVGVGSNDDPNSVAENRRRVRSAMGATGMVSGYQVHGANIVSVVEPWGAAARPKCDGLVSKQLGVALCILTADCVPVLFADIRLPIIGAAHAGWKGAFGGVCEATIEAMEALGSRRRDLVCAIGPAIQQESYEVGPEFAQRFIERDAYNRSFFQAGSGDRLHFDLTGYVHRRVASARVGWIETLRDDTCAQSAYFSNRRRTQLGESDYGRNASVIVLSPD